MHNFLTLNLILRRDTQMNLCTLLHFFKRRITVLFLVCCTVAVADQNPSMDDLLELSLEDLLQVTVTTASKYEENITDTPFTVIT